jgi:hypothetical protein
VKKAIKFLLLSLLLIIGFSSQTFAQSITGKILNEDGEPIPYANVFVREAQAGTNSDEEGKYFMTLPTGGEYEIVFSSIGYESKSMEIVVGDVEVRLDIQLKTSSIDMDEIVIKASKKDSAYTLIKQVIDNKKSYLASVQSFKSDVYVKAIELIDNQKKAKENKNEDIDKLEGDEPEEVDPFAEQNKENQKLLSSLNMVEMNLVLNYQFPKKYKEERSAYEKSGSDKGLFIPLFGEADFNFYRNMVRLDGIAETPVISPISTTSILSYKYKLMETLNEGGQIVYKIKVIPRKSGNATCKGYIYINEGIWNINRLDFEIHKGGLRIYDAFRLKIDYQQVEDTLWIPTRQEFTYETKQGRFKTYKGSTVMKYSNYQNNYQFEPKFFSNEVVRYDKDAYDKDTTYWNQNRAEPLKAEEAKVVFLRDSMSAILNSDEYKDSVTAAYNKITFLDILWDGVGFRNNDKQTSWYIGPLPSLINYDVVGGFRASPFVFHSKRWKETGKRMNMSGNVSYGIKNKDVQGNLRSWFLYNPHKLASVRFGVGRNYRSINRYDAFLNQLSISNYILNEEIYGSHRFEIVNGLYLSTGFSFNNRRSIADIDASSGLANWIEGLTNNEGAEPIAFEPYKALITDIRISYTPFQKYMTQPKNKVILGSDYPTITLQHRKGWAGAFESSVDFDYVEVSLRHDLVLGQFGNSKYSAKVGTFVSDDELKFIDLKRFRQSDPFLYSDPLNSFQALDTSIATSKPFFEFHYIHHFNGALVNNIPLIKKTNVRFVVGGGLMYIQENNLRHEEVFAGIERVFKLGARRRMRIGLYGVLANSNYASPNTEYKISFDIIDTWKKDWSF